MKISSQITVTIFFFSLALGLFQIASCKKKETTIPTPKVVETCSDGIKNQDEVETDCGGICTPCAIKYPQTGTYGDNVLHGNDTLRIAGTGNSFMATVPVGSTLKVELNLISGSVWGITAGSTVGWSVSNLDWVNKKQTFNVLNPGTNELRFSKLEFDPGGIILVKFFENSTTETRRKIIVWN